MPRSGRPFSVAMTNLGPLGWVSDRSGYRYQESHPDTGAPWPAMPQMILELWRAVSGIRMTRKPAW
jgi:DNA oxidative demethylase